MGCQEPVLCLNCDITNPARNDCLTQNTGFGSPTLTNAVAPCDPSKCYTERWFGNIRGINASVSATPPPAGSDIGFPTIGCSDEYVDAVFAWLRDPEMALKALNEKDAVTAVEVRVAIIFLVDYQMASNGFAASYPVDRGFNGTSITSVCSRECWENQFFTSDVFYEGMQEYFPVPPFGSNNTPMSWNPSGDATCCLPEGDGRIDEDSCKDTGTNCVCCDPSLSLPIQTGAGDEILIANTPENAKLVTELVICGPASNPQGVAPIPIKGQSNSLCGEPN